MFSDLIKHFLFIVWFVFHSFHPSRYSIRQIFMQYIAFLRGINSGKNPTTKMEVLRGAFEKMGFESVRTVIASGNVIFSSHNLNKKDLIEKIEKELPEKIGFQSDVNLLSIDELELLIKSDPFKDIKETKDARLFVTFVKHPPESHNVKDGMGYKLLGFFQNALCFVIDLTDVRTPDIMSILDKEFGRQITTRSWKTVERIFNIAKEMT